MNIVKPYLNMYTKNVAQAVVIILLTTYGNAAFSSEWGSFSGNVKTEWLSDDGRRMKLLEDFTYTDPLGVEWVAPVDSVVDGASIPKFAWPIVGSPFEGKYRNASVVHDVACIQKEHPWEAVHLAFYYAMRAGGVSLTKAKIMYAAVYLGGPKWPRKVKYKAVTREEAKRIAEDIREESDPDSQIVERITENPASKSGAEVVDVLVRVRPPEKTISEDDFISIKSIIESDNLSLDAIRNWRP